MPPSWGGSVPSPSANDLLLGRKTDDIFAGYGPHVPADNPVGVVFTRANKYVMTSGTGRLGWANSHPVRSIAALKRIKAGPARDIVLWDSSALYRPLLAANRIDRPHHGR